MLFLNKETIDIVKRFVFELSPEVCANLRRRNRSSNELILTNINKMGSEEEYAVGKFRKTCNWEIITSVIFHTHPVSSYAYPSVEDILKVVKNKGKIVRSILATKWGVWDIKNTNENELNNECKDILYRYIKSCLDKIGLSTRESIDIKVINNNIRKIERVLGISITLFLWEEIKDGLILLD